jgi:hypothetical protein
VTPEEYDALIASEVEAVRDAMTDEQAHRVSIILAPHVRGRRQAQAKGGDCPTS